MAYFPLDVTKLVKGQTLEIPKLEAVFGIHYPNELWWSKLLWLREQIDKSRRKLGLSLLTMRIRKGRLVVCDDSDAAHYNERMGKRGLRRFRRAYARNHAVDVTKLTDEERRAHDASLKRQQMLFPALRGESHKPLLENPQRVTPPMLSTK